MHDQHTASYQRTTDSKVSPTDPEAAPMRRFSDDRAQLGYHTQYVVDGGKARITLAALVTPASVMDNTPMLDLERWVRFRWHLKPAIAVGDAKYGTVPNIVGLEQDGIKAYLPTADFSERNAFYPCERFQYDAERDRYLCPQGQVLSLRSRRKREQRLLYRAEAQACKGCSVKAECTDSPVWRADCAPRLDEARHRAARVVATSSARSSRPISIAPKPIVRPQRNRKRCASAWSGWSHSSARPSNGRGWCDSACGVC